ncbi:MAG: YraN family protein [Planctomycetia bacterium]|nr:YraN family protein [Planctomycetia bacterium]
MGSASLLSRLRIAWRRYRSLGASGERAAERYLRRRRYKIVARRERGRLGELDLVAVDGRTIVFVEVKTRRSRRAGHPAEAVGPQKQQRLTRLALAYLKRHELLEYSSRFDVLAITWPADARNPTIEHIKNAFEAVGRGQMFN